MIQVVLFDYGGVLTEAGTHGGMVRLVAHAFKIPLHEAKRSQPLLDTFLLGRFTTDEFLQAAGKLYPNAPTPQAADLLQGDTIFMPSQLVYNLAVQLREHGLRTAILSNMFALSAATLRQRGLYDGFDPVIVSCDEHLAKPDPAIYRRALQRLGVPADAVLFVDDQERFIAPAQRLGMQVVVATTPAQIVSEVRAALLKYNNLRLP